MPELPEVEVVRAGLAPAVTGARVAGVEVLDARSLKRHDAASGAFETLVTGARIEAAVRRGKFLWLPFQPAAVRAPDAADGGAFAGTVRPGHPLALVGHLGMSGQMLLRTPDHPGDDRHARIRLHLEHPGHGELRVDFVDQRIFGSLAVDRLVPTPDGAIAGFSAGVTGAWARSIPTQVAHIARDPLDPAVDEAAFVAALARRATGIKRVLLDQGVVSGIGNIYADEALWAARLHPEQPAASLSRRKTGELLAAVRDVLLKALAEGGTSFDAQYVNVNGASGYFAHSLNAYGRTGRPCPRCGTPIVREPFMNRSSHRCPRCQRLRIPR
ncbi:bifunctional DNA-formamidopyrimidine glycosylase/DNA-(apurinic or apyrimidinic site) lyase [Agromyces aerolatus]|uniref:bifunctional DNA-formamidopyrimidine glycosylase/DNA-(apurinic or apyrimidinic site) lyase n=1 Tax=Agromyces sp. LY-1074 TaxID=3074080 RepID=UPI00285FAE34|nr:MULTISPECIES: bifunctional DNA-formamidopyrimidine glycosylase/DNA-(apurinic or apyrimidinic site) lyase [unclassified Agromyces]MDR5699983.1 bifunctional DNA-formamidopyrimidine glycosylase/DNA-(apurinic or apyrimidinic site) lyase [Agromyces sp. LY-1074]MDR5706205.1 bifunctional DNA-formamidopyrimidine glycosylase/DNA-(apurinic or apyrimidinic site) lyase [Agromyces sp. LY-1358]